MPRKPPSSFPNFPRKHEQEAFFSPRDYLDYLRHLGVVPDFIVPDGVIFCFQNALLRHIEQQHDVESVSLFAGRFYLLPGLDHRIAVSGGFGIGAPIVTTILEELIAIGVQRFISVGTAGALAKELRIGDVVVCERAIRDEGVSHHYLAPARYAHASPSLTNQLESALRQVGMQPVRGASWTIDTPYRESVAEARHYQAEGVLTVEMEAAALFAVAEYRGVELTAAFAISDSLAELVWNPQFRASETQGSLTRVFGAAVEALLESAPRLQNEEASS
jgi:uridine phosphorylase